MIQLESILTEYFPKLRSKPKLLRFIASVLSRVISLDKLSDLVERHKDFEGFEFIEKVLADLNVTYAFSHQDIENIPTHGRVIVIANHPIGTLDGLALLHLISKVRKDVKIVVNEVLGSIQQISSVTLLVDNMTKKSKKEQLAVIKQALEDEQIIIFFPAGEVSRWSFQGIKDGHWATGFLRMAHSTGAPILPVHIKGRNSNLFYFVSALVSRLGAFLLLRETFRNKATNLPIKIGELIEFSEIKTMDIPLSEKARLFRKHVYNMAKNKPLMFKTATAIAHPEKRQPIYKELKEGEYLGKLSKSKHIFLIRYNNDSPVMRELGRLREIAFRQVGEGTGKHRDIDTFDKSYQHIILWDDQDLEIVGAYRVAILEDVDACLAASEPMLYSQTLFDFKASFKPYLKEGVEFGRSFIQPRYWGKKSLDYLWFGVGAFLAKHPDKRYLFGPVSVSASLPKIVRDALVYYYRHYFSTKETLAVARTPHIIDKHNELQFKDWFVHNSREEDLVRLKRLLGHFNSTIPTLYKQYTALYNSGGVHYLDFNVDVEFGDCTDGLILADIKEMKQDKYERYIKHLEANSV